MSSPLGVLLLNQPDRDTGALSYFGICRLRPYLYVAFNYTTLIVDFLSTGRRLSTESFCMSHEIDNRNLCL